MNPYATNKALLHVPRLAAFRRGAQPDPVHLQLVVANVCNQACGFCAYRSEGYSSSEMFDARLILPTPTVIALLGSAARLGVRGVQFTGGGEPTVHPDLATFLDVADALGMEAALVTNGKRLSPGVQRAALRASWLRVSIDAATPETYAAIRNERDPRVFDAVKANVRDLVALRTEAGSNLYIGVGFVVTRDNWTEIPAAVDLAEDLGVDNLRFAAVFSVEDGRAFEGIADEALALCRAAAARSRPGFLVSDNFVERLADLRLGPPLEERCAYQHLTTYVGADGNAYRCCVLAYNPRGLLGAVTDGDLVRFWHSEGKRAKMEAFDARGCVRCQFNARNREMNALIAALPDGHGNFP